MIDNNNNKNEYDSIYEVTSYGFDKDIACIALSICNNDVIKAIQYIIDQQYIIKNPVKHDKVEIKLYNIS